MRYIVEAGTDVASLLLFDPGALPADFDCRTQGRGFFELLEALAQAGVVSWINTGADGAYLLHVYVGEPVPVAVHPYLRDPITTDPLAVPTGRLFFTGAEYAFREDDSFLQRYPHMGGTFAVRPGSYRLTCWRTEYPEGLAEDLLRQQVSAGAFRLFDGFGCLVMLAVLGLVGLGATAAIVPRQAWLWYLLPACLVLITLPLVVARLAPYREAQRRYRVIERELPSIVARLELSNEAAPTVAPDWAGHSGFEEV